MRVAAAAALEKKGSNIEILTMTDFLSIVDWFLLVSAPSARQVRAIVDEVEKKLKECGASTIRTEGVTEGEWCLLDYGDLVIHVFTDEMRDFYSLGHLWADAPRLELESETFSGQQMGAGLS